MKKTMSLSIDRRKLLLINILFGSSILIMFLGLYFSFFSLINQITIKVLNSNIHGVVFGILVFYLGLRYFLSVSKLQTEVRKDSAKFSWANFKRSKKRKTSR
jgi:uncharacterized membrane protein